MTTITQSVLTDRFDEVIEGDFDRSQFRLSNTGKCQRMRMLKVLGYEAEEIDESTAQTFERGNLLEDWFVDQIIKKYPRKTRKQLEVHTPYGDTGHMDIWFPRPEDKPPTIIEVKSVHEKARYYLPKDDHINQVQSYMHFFTDSRGNRRADRAEIIYIFFGRKLETQSYEIKYDEVAGQRIENELKLLHEWREKNHVPEIPEDKAPDQFPCFWTTSDGNEGNCPYYQHCWMGEQSGEMEEGPVFDDDTMQQLISEYEQIKGRYSAANKKLKQLKKEKKQLEKALRKNLKIRGTDTAVVGNRRIKKVDVAGRIYWKPKRALKQGLIDEETLEKIKQASDESSGYTRFYLKKVERGD